MAPRPSPGVYDKRYVHVDVLVAGGGPAGMAAAVAAADAGASVLLVEEEYELGGHLRWGGKAELELLAELHEVLGRDAAMIFVVHDLNPRAMSPKVQGFVQAQSWFQDLTPIKVEN